MQTRITTQALWVSKKRNTNHLLLVFLDFDLGLDLLDDSSSLFDLFFLLALDRDFDFYCDELYSFRYLRVLDIFDLRGWKLISGLEDAFSSEDSLRLGLASSSLDSLFDS